MGRVKAPARSGIARFALVVLGIAGLLILAIGLIAYFGGDGGSLPFLYEGFN